MIAVQITCRTCDERIGTALVQIHKKKVPPTMSVRDARKFKDMPPISFDDVLDAHEFIQGLDHTWVKYLKR